MVASEGDAPRSERVSPVDAWLGHPPARSPDWDALAASKQRGQPVRMRRVPVDFEVPVTFRNWNFGKSTLMFALLAGLLAWMNVVSSWRLEWLGIGLLVAAVVGTLYFAASWWWATLSVDHDRVRVGGVVRRVTCEWGEIERFTIMRPDDRSPFMLAFWWWRDQARLVVRDGSSRRVRAIEPRHGFTVLTYVQIKDETDADQKVAWLNQLVETRQSAAP